MLNVGFMSSYNGSGMMSVLNASQNGLQVKPTVLICNNKDANAFSNVKPFNLSAFHLSSTTHPDPADLDKVICTTLQEHNIDLLILSGYMKKLGPQTLETFKNKILNIHPSLLPKFGGKGMYGDHVHQAVLESKDSETGATVHIVTAEYDQGPVLNQQKIALSDNETLDSIRDKVRAIENNLYVDTLEKVISGDIKVPDLNICSI